MGRWTEGPGNHLALVGVLAAAAVLLALLSGMSAGGQSPVPSQSEVVEATTEPAHSTLAVSDPVPVASDPVVSGSTSTSVPAAGQDVNVAEEQVDILLYGTQTSALGVLRAFLLSRERYPQMLTLAVVSPSGGLESPLAQGLSVEDEYYPERTSGFYREFRQAVLAEYSEQGIDPRLDGRLTYEPTVASRVLLDLSGLDGLSSGEKRTWGTRTIAYYQGSLVAAEDGEFSSVQVRLTGGKLLCFRCRYLIDASTEADLARMVGCDYALGTSPFVYNDIKGRKPDLPTSANRYITAPQSLSLLVTLAVGRQSRSGLGEQDQVAGQSEDVYLLGPEIWAGFARSWSMSHPLPHGKRELNESWSDYRDSMTSYEWFIHPERREEILGELTRRTLAQVEELREHGYPDLEITSLPIYPYVRGELMVVGEDTYRLKDLEEETVREPVAVGCYALFDRHDPGQGSTQTPESAVARLPLGTIQPWGHPYLLVSTAFSCEWRVYSSAVRMENLRANAGAAAGVLAVLAAAGETAAGEVPYERVLAELEYQGHDIW